MRPTSPRTAAESPLRRTAEASAHPPAPSARARSGPGRAPRALTRLALALALAGCASTPEPAPLPPPPAPGEGGVLVGPWAADYTATAAREVVLATDDVPQYAALECAACGVTAEPAVALGTGAVDPGRGGRPRGPCRACGGSRLRAPFGPPYRPGADLAALRARTVELLAERGGLGRASAQAPPGAPPDAPETPGSGPTPRWRLEVTLDGADLVLERHNGWLPVKIGTLVACALAIFPAVDPPNWFIASEVYALEQRARWRLVDVEAGAEREGRVVVRTRADVAAFGPGVTRAWFVLGFLRVPHCLDEEDWAELALQLGPTAQEDLARAVVIAVEQAARPRAE